MDFFTSWAGVVVAAIVGLFILVMAVVMKNNIWPSRGITPKEEVKGPERRQLPKMFYSRSLWTMFGSIVLIVGLIALVATGLHGTHGTLSQAVASPSFSTIWLVAQAYWFWILLMLGLAFAVFSFVPKDVKVAKKLQGAVIAVGVFLFIVVPFGARVASPSKVPTQPIASEMPAPDEYWKIPPDTVSRSQWPKVVVGPGEQSVHIEAPAFTPLHYEIEGEGTRADYEVYVYYASEAHIPDCLLSQEAPCQGGWKGIYFKNKRTDDHSITMDYATHSS